MADFDITGVNQLAEVGRKLKGADRSLRLKLGRNIRAAVAPVPTAVRSNTSRLPKSGGLAAMVAKSKFGTRIRTLGNNVGVQVRMTNPHDINAMDRGRLRHPTFGKKPWVNQQVEPKFFTDATEATAPLVREAVKRAIDETAREF